MPTKKTTTKTATAKKPATKKKATVKKSNPACEYSAQAKSALDIIRKHEANKKQVCIMSAKRQRHLNGNESDNDIMNFIDTYKPDQLGLLQHGVREFVKL